MSASLSALREGRADLASLRELSASTLSREDRRAALSACIKIIGSGKVTDGKEDRKTLRMLLYFVESLSALECKELSLPAPGGMLAHLVVGQEGQGEGSSHVAADICELAKSHQADAQLLRSKLVEPAMRALAKGGELSHTHLPRRSAALRTLAALCAMGGDRTQLWSVLLPLLEGEVRVGEKAGQAKGGSGLFSSILGPSKRSPAECAHVEAAAFSALRRWILAAGSGGVAQAEAQRLCPLLPFGFKSTHAAAAAAAFDCAASIARCGVAQAAAVAKIVLPLARALAAGKGVRAEAANLGSSRCATAFVRCCAALATETAAKPATAQAFLAAASSLAVSDGRPAVQAAAAAAMVGDAGPTPPAVSPPPPPLHGGAALARPRAAAEDALRAGLCSVAEATSGAGACPAAAAARACLDSRRSFRAWSLLVGGGGGGEGVGRGKSKAAEGVSVEVALAPLLSLCALATDSLLGTVGSGRVTSGKKRGGGGSRSGRRTRRSPTAAAILSAAVRAVRLFALTLRARVATAEEDELRGREGDGDGDGDGVGEAAASTVATTATTAAAATATTAAATTAATSAADSGDLLGLGGIDFSPGTATSGNGVGITSGSGSSGLFDLEDVFSVQPTPTATLGTTTTTTAVAAAAMVAGRGGLGREAFEKAMQGLGSSWREVAEAPAGSSSSPLLLASKLCWAAARDDTGAVDPSIRLMALRALVWLEPDPRSVQWKRRGGGSGSGSVASERESGGGLAAPPPLAEALVSPLLPLLPPRQAAALAAELRCRAEMSLGSMEPEVEPRLVDGGVDLGLGVGKGSGNEAAAGGGAGDGGEVVEAEPFLSLALRVAVRPEGPALAAAACAPLMLERAWAQCLGLAKLQLEIAEERKRRSEGALSVTFGGMGLSPSGIFNSNSSSSSSSSSNNSNRYNHFSVYFGARAASILDAATDSCFDVLDHRRWRGGASEVLVPCGAAVRAAVAFLGEHGVELAGLRPPEGEGGKRTGGMGEGKETQEGKGKDGERKARQVQGALQAGVASSSAPRQAVEDGLQGLQGLAGLEISSPPSTTSASTTAQQEAQEKKQDSMFALLNLYEGRGPGQSTSASPYFASTSSSSASDTARQGGSSSDPSAFASAAGIANRTARAVVLRLAAICTGDGDGLTRRAAARAIGALAADPAAGKNEPLRVACYAVLAGVEGKGDLAEGEAREALKLLDGLYEAEERGDAAVEGKGEGGDGVVAL